MDDSDVCCCAEEELTDLEGEGEGEEGEDHTLAPCVFLGGAEGEMSTEDGRPVSADRTEPGVCLGSV